MSEIKVGFSEKINDEKITRALAKNKKIAFIWAIILIIIPLIIGFIVYSMGNEEALTVGVGVSIVFLLCFIIPSLKKKLGKEWEGIVTTKEIKKVRRKVKDDYVEDTYYIINIEKTNGSKTKIKEVETYHLYYDYLNEGDKIKYHPKFNNCYEKYDKSNDTYIYCAVCQTKNDISNDECKKCNAPLLK